MRQIYFRDPVTLDDLIWSPVYLILVLLAAAFIRNSMYRMDNPIRKYFMPGLMVKLLGGISVGLIYAFYYTGGDTTEFFNNSIVFNSAFGDSPILFFKLLINPAVNHDPDITMYRPWMYFIFDPASYTVGKIAGIINLFTFNIYTAEAILFAAVSFSGVWALYITFCKIYPDMYKQFALAVLFIPSVFFWGSGILKDSITLGCVGWITFCSYNIFFMKRKVISNSIVWIIAAALVAMIKPYILFAFMPSLLFWVFLHYRSQIKSTFLKVVSGPFVFIASLGLGAIVIQRLGREFTQFSVGGALATSQNFQSYHGYLAQSGVAGSGYNLGEMDGSFMSIFTRIPAAINVTLFRPYLWESHNPVMLLSALESTIIMIFTFRIIYKTGLGTTLKTLGRSPTAFFCIFFAMFFGFCVGFTAYNFGALVRYKIPCIPFYVAGLFILHKETLIAYEAKQKLKRVNRTN
jgi:hypothetical protein